MIFFEDVAAERPRIEEAIRKFGYAPEHNFDWYRFYTDDDEKDIFAAGAHGDGLFTMTSDGEARVFSSPVAPPERRAPLLIEYCERIFQAPPAFDGAGSIKKIWLELETPLRKEFLSALPPALKANPINYTLTWPVMNMKTFDPALPGGHYKSLRKEKHKFYRNHAVVVADAKAFEDKKSLRAIVDVWKKRRKVRDRAYCAEYYHLIGGNFAGTSEARVFIVDGKAVGINAGWMMPNSGRFYGAVGLHDYSIPNLGAMLYLEDLEWLKGRGYGEADMGGGEKGLTEFKKEFMPASFYKTHVFSVVRR